MATQKQISEAKAHEEHVSYSVFCTPSGEWRITWYGQSNQYPTQDAARADAITWAKTEFEMNGCTAEVSVHRLNGTVGEKNTYGIDPESSKG